MSGLRLWVLGLGVAMAIAGGVSVSTAETDALASPSPNLFWFPFRRPNQRESDRSGLGSHTGVHWTRPGSRGYGRGGLRPVGALPIRRFSPSTARGRSLRVEARSRRPMGQDRARPVERSLKRAFDNLSMPAFVW